MTQTPKGEARTLHDAIYAVLRAQEEQPKGALPPSVTIAISELRAALAQSRTPEPAPIRDLSSEIGFEDGWDSTESNSGAVQRAAIQDQIANEREGIAPLSSVPSASGDPSSPSSVSSGSGASGERPEAAGWRPIESARFIDGELVMLAREDEWVAMGSYSPEASEWREVNNDVTDTWGEPLYPTHWMPNPLPPTASGSPLPSEPNENDSSVRGSGGVPEPLTDHIFFLHTVRNGLEKAWRMSPEGRTALEAFDAALRALGAKS